MTYYKNRLTDELYEAETPEKRNIATGAQTLVTQEPDGHTTEIIDGKTVQTTLYKTVEQEIPFNEYLEDDPATEEEIAQWQADAAQREASEAQEQINHEARQFLADTDWKVIRHRDQLAQGITTSLTTEEFQQLLAQRQTRRDEVV